MKFSLAHFALASCVVAAPTALEPRGLTDIDILNFALTLEHLEATFYKEALAKFGPTDFKKAKAAAGVRANVVEVGKDETTHVQFLTSVIKSLKATPVKKCSYDFGLKTVQDFIKLASVLEGVGVTAYLGAADLISNKAYIEPAGAILTVEARHNAYIRDNFLPKGRSPFPAPFDVPQSPRAVFTLASQFIKSCPKGSDLPFTAFPLLTPVTSKKSEFAVLAVKKGDTKEYQVPKHVKLPKKVYAAFAGTPAPVMAPVKVLNDRTVRITVPKGVYGQSFLSLYSSKSFSQSSTIAGPAILEINS